MDKFDLSQFSFTHKHYYLLLAYQVERNQAEARRAVEYELHESLNPGCHVSPITQELIDWGLIIRTNPDAPKSQGYKHFITEAGRYALEDYFKRMEAVAQPNPRHGY